MKLHCLIGLVVLAAAPAASPAADGPVTRPAFQVDSPFPTADKPQSKLWHAAGSWWALLPRAEGPSLWQRTAAGWREHADVAARLRGVPGRGDVWADGDEATVVTVADRMLAVLRVRTAPAGGPVAAEVLARLGTPVSDTIETATLGRDGQGHWWIVAPVAGRVFAWHSADGRAWSGAMSLAGGLHVDDIALVTPSPGGVAAIWSDQKGATVKSRLHRDGAPPGQWEKPVTIAEGNDTADDHLDAAYEADGTLWLATKNSVDRAGAPQLVLRVGRPGGGWSNHDYAPLTDTDGPTRPAVIATPTPGEVLLGHVVYDGRRPRRDHVVFGRVDLRRPEILVGARTVIAPEDPKARVNDITGPKAAFPVQGPWIVLASDAEGRVYEADLRTDRGG